MQTNAIKITQKLNIKKEMNNKQIYSQNYKVKKPKCFLLPKLLEKQFQMLVVFGARKW